MLELRCGVGVDVLLVGLVVVGTVLSVFHDITFVETVGLNMAENPMSLLNLAGGIALLILLGKGVQLALKFA